eukprot:2694309-Rhodomonas_salina.3
MLRSLFLCIASVATLSSVVDAFSVPVGSGFGYTQRSPLLRRSAIEECRMRVEQSTPRVARRAALGKFMGVGAALAMSSEAASAEETELDKFKLVQIMKVSLSLFPLSDATS